MVSLNDSDIRTLASVLTGAISMSAFYGKSSVTAIGDVWTINRIDVGLRAIASLSTGFIAVGTLGRIITSTDGINWTIRTSGTTNDLFGVWYDVASSLAVAVGTNGTILTSSDLITWTTQTSGVSITLRDVVRSGSSWVAVGDTATVLTSSNASSWTAQTSGQPYGINSVTWTGSVFIACCNNQYIISSPNGITWTTRLTGTSGVFNKVRWGSGLAIVVGTSGRILTSPDGTTWTIRTSGTTEEIIGIMRGTSYWVGLGAGIRTSTTGTTWSFHTTPGPIMYAGAFNAALNLYVAVGSDNFIFTSTAGNTSYTQRQRTFDIQDLAYSPSLNRYVICGTQGRVEYSSDAVNWAIGGSGVATGNTLSNIVWNGSIFAAVTSLTSGPITTSTTGINFTSRNTSTPLGLYAITWDANSNNFIAAGNGGYLTKSSDGTNWTNLTNRYSNNDMVYASIGVGLYVMVGAGGSIYTSTDALNWTKRDSGSTTAIFYCIHWNGTTLIAAGSGGTVRTSTNGINWTAGTFGTTGQINGIVWAGDKFVAVGATGTIRTSPDGLTWTARTSGTTNTFNSVAYDGTTIVAAGVTGTIRTSTDGITWTTRTFGTTTTIQKVIYSGSTFVALAGNTSRYSSNGTTWSGGGSPNLTLSVTSSIATNGTVIAIGANTGLIRISTNSGLNWSAQTTISSQSLGAMCWDGSKFVVATTSSNQLIHSNNAGTAWPIVVSGSNIRGITINSSGTCVIVGGEGLIQTTTSTDITNNVLPTIRNMSNSYAFNAVAWSGTQFLAVGTVGNVFTSPDGTTWTPRTSGVSTELTGVKWVDTRFIVSGTGGVIITSPDGITWAAKTSNTNYNLTNIEYLNNRAFATGLSGVILQSGP
jgi:hypothetical protein